MIVLGHLLMPSVCSLTRSMSLMMGSETKEAALFSRGHFISVGCHLHRTWARPRETAHGLKRGATHGPPVGSMF